MIAIQFFTISILPFGLNKHNFAEDIFRPKSDISGNYSMSIELIIRDIYPGLHKHKHNNNQVLVQHQKKSRPE